MKRGSFKQLACRNCRLILDLTVGKCPNCRKDDFSDDWTGLVIVIDSKGSWVAEKLNLTKEGRYAIKVRR